MMMTMIVVVRCNMRAGEILGRQALYSGVPELTQQLRGRCSSVFCQLVVIACLPRFQIGPLKFTVSGAVWN